MTPPKESNPAVKNLLQHLCDTIKKLLRRRMSEESFVFVAASLMGVGAGVMAQLLKSGISILSTWITASVGKDIPDWLLLVSPAVGVLIVVALIKYVFKLQLSHGEDVVTSHMNNKNPDLPGQLTYSPLLASALSLGFGGSAGSEGPIAYSGAALGSTIGRAFRLSPSMRMLMLGCGAGAGIAAIFKAPIGGAFYTLEVLRMELGAFGVMLLGVSTLMAALTATALGDFNLDMIMEQVQHYDPAILPWAVALGLFCGLYSVYYSYIMKLVGKWITAVNNIWVRGAVSGLLVGATLLFIPSLYGEGYGVMGHILNFDPRAMAFGTFWEKQASDPTVLILLALAVVLVKCFVTSLSFNGGGVTGQFAPTLFAGCFAGFLFGAVCNHFLGADLPITQMAFFGMAGVMAGAIRAPLMAMFIVVEMSSAYTLLLPVAIVATLSFGIVRLFSSMSANNHL